MAHEWKVGDRFSLEGTVEHADNGYVTVAVGPRKMTYGFHYADFEDAKLIHRAKELPKLDLKKPMEVMDSNGNLPVVCKGVSSNGNIIVQFQDGTFDALIPAMLRNIPDPEEILEYRLAVVQLWDTGGIRNDDGTWAGVKSRARITWSKSQGWRIEEVDGEK